MHRASGVISSATGSWSGANRPVKRAKVSRVTDQRDQLGEEPESGPSAAGGQTHTLRPPALDLPL